MRKSLPNLTWIRTFEVAARLLNFTEAGKELGLTQTAVSLHIKSLEETLGCRLFVRNARHLSLTAIGQAYVHSVSEMLAGLDLATTSLFGSTAGQVVTLRAPISTAVLWLAPHIPMFNADYPDIHVRLISTIWANSISDEDADIDLRQGVGNWPGFQAQKISEESIVPITGLHDRLEDTPLIQVLGLEDMWRRYAAKSGLADMAAADITVDTTAVAVALVASGGGHAAVQTRFAKSAIKSGYPIKIAGSPVEFPQSHYLLRGQSPRAHRPETEILREWLRSLFADSEGTPLF